MNDDLREFIRARLDALGINPFEAARRGNLERGFINDILIGRKNSIRDDKKAQVALALDIPVSELWFEQKSRRVPILGYAAANGDAVTFFSDAQGPLDEVEAPEGSTPETVAVQVRGVSLGRLFDGWLAFYDDVRNPPEGPMLNRVCICGLADGRVMIKKLRPGSAKGLFHLESETEPTLFDVPVEWAAVVRTMRQ